MLGTACLVGFGSSKSNGQGAFKAQVSDVVVPAVKDTQGRTAVLRAKGANPLANGQLPITGMQIELSRDGAQDMIIEAASCTLDPRTRVAFSDSDITVRKANGSLLIRGTGFQWQHQNTRLVISNAVQTIIRKDLLNLPSANTNAAARTPANLPQAKSAVASKATNAPAGTNQTIEIVSDRLDFHGDAAVFSGRVRAEDGLAKLSCGVLKAFFEAIGGEVGKIEAEQQVIFEQGEIRTGSDRAVYLLNEEHITLTGNPTWKMRNSEGRGGLIAVKNKTREFRVERDVVVQLASDKVLPLEWFASDASTNSAPARVESVTIAADELDYKTELASFRGHVRVADPRGGTLSSRKLTAGFAPSDGKLVRLDAEENVEIQQRGTSARGERAVYVAADELMTLTGNPNWTTQQGEGKSDTLIFNSKTRQVHGHGSVRMKFIDLAGGPLDLGLVKSPQSTNTGSRLPQPVEVFSDHLFSKPGSAIFLGQVRVADPANTTNSMKSEVLAAFFRTSDNKLDQLIAEDNIEIRQGLLRATGKKAIYWVADGLITLTGNPEIASPSRKFVADEFVIDRVRNTYRIVGNYRIEMERRPVGSSASLTPQK
jgi:lipopolysaccharide export system protein LptA